MSTEAAKRLNAYIDGYNLYYALRARYGRRYHWQLSVIEGPFQQRGLTCPGCGSLRQTYEEKETDVNIAATLIRGAGYVRHRAAHLGRC